MGETWWLEEALRELKGRLGYEENGKAEDNEKGEGRGSGAVGEGKLG